MNHVVYMDNFFTSGPLVDELAKHDIFVAGTIQQTAQGFANELKGLKLPVGQFAGVSTGGTSYHTFKDRKMVSFVSNAFPVAMKGRVARLPPNQKVLRYQQVPPVLPAYNKFMGAVHRCNHLRKSYGYDRKSKRYWVRPFMIFFILPSLTLSDKSGCRNATGCKKSHRRPRLGRRLALSAALTAPDILTMAEVGCELWCGKSQVLCL